MVGVTDGNTLTVLTASKRRMTICLGGIDAPEIGQPFGDESRQALSNLAYGREVTVMIRFRDRHGLSAADVWVRPALNSAARSATGRADKSLSEEQVSRGMAWWNSRYGAFEGDLELREAEAREAKRGLWRDGKPVPPWLWPGKGGVKTKTFPAAPPSSRSPQSLSALVINF